MYFLEHSPSACLVEPGCLQAAEVPVPLLYVKRSAETSEFPRAVHQGDVVDRMRSLRVVGARNDKIGSWFYLPPRLHLCLFTPAPSSFVRVFKVIFSCISVHSHWKETETVPE